MQDGQVSSFGSGEQHVLERTQRLLEHWGKTVERPLQPSPETLKRTVELLSQLPEAYRALGMTKLAEYFSAALSIHFFDIINTFRQKAVEEEMDEEEVKQALNDVMQELFPEMMSISKQVFTRTLDDLIALSNITFSLYTLSQSNSAEVAQDWMYELPVLYRRQLAQERLLVSSQIRVTVTISPVLRNRATSWSSSLPNPVEVQTKIGGAPTIA